MRQYAPIYVRRADPAAARQIFVKDHSKYLPALGRPLISGGAQQAEQSMMNFTTCAPHPALHWLHSWHDPPLEVVAVPPEHLVVF